MSIDLKLYIILLIYFFKQIAWFSAEVVPIVCLFIYLFIYSAAPGLSCSRWAPWLQHVGSLVVACELLVAACIWDLVPRPGIKPGLPALGAQSLIHCATREVPIYILF